MAAGIWVLGTFLLALAASPNLGEDRRPTDADTEQSLPGVRLTVSLHLRQVLTGEERPKTLAASSLVSPKRPGTRLRRLL